MITNTFCFRGAKLLIFLHIFNLLFSINQLNRLISANTVFLKSKDYLCAVLNVYFFIFIT